MKKNIVSIGQNNAHPPNPTIGQFESALAEIEKQDAVLDSVFDALVCRTNDDRGIVLGYLKSGQLAVFRRGRVKTVSLRGASDAYITAYKTGDWSTYSGFERFFRDIGRALKGDAQ